MVYDISTLCAGLGPIQHRDFTKLPAAGRVISGRKIDLHLEENAQTKTARRGATEISGTTTIFAAKATQYHVPVTGNAFLLAREIGQLQ